jgi:hypothetical protein
LPMHEMHMWEYEHSGPISDVELLPPWEIKQMAAESVKTRRKTVRGLN